MGIIFHLTKTIMTREKLAGIWEFAKIAFIISFIVWLIETIVFLFIDGWHFKATNPIEIELDKITADGMKVGWYAAVYCGFHLLSSLNKKNNHEDNR